MTLLRLDEDEKDINLANYNQYGRFPVVWARQWQAGRTYFQDQTVVHNDQLWICESATAEEPSTNSTSWQKLTAFSPFAGSSSETQLPADILLQGKVAASDVTSGVFSSDRLPSASATAKGAIGPLPNLANQYFSGDGTWKNLPSASTSTGSGTIQTATNGGLTGNGSPTTPLAIDFTKVAVSNHSHDYSSLTNKPTIPSDVSQLTDSTNRLFSGSYTALTNKPTLFSGNYADLTNKPILFSGSYVDLTNKPTIPTQLASLTDVNLAGAADDQVLTYSLATSKWIPKTPAASGNAGVIIHKVVQATSTTFTTTGSFQDILTLTFTPKFYNSIFDIRVICRGCFVSYLGATAFQLDISSNNTVTATSKQLSSSIIALASADTTPANYAGFQERVYRYDQGSAVTTNDTYYGNLTFQKGGETTIPTFTIKLRYTNTSGRTLWVSYFNKPTAIYAIEYPLPDN